MNTPGIIQNADPHHWKAHRFGLSEQRWNNLSGKSFWITGGGTGYGRAIAMALAAANSRVFITGRRQEKLQETIKEIISFNIDPHNIIPITADITSATAVTSAIEQIAQKSDSLYGLIHSAALPPPAAGPWPLMQMNETQWHLLWQTNVFAAWLITKAALPLLLKNVQQRILFLSSEAGWNFTVGVGAYNVTKAALNNLGVSFAEEIRACYPEKDFQLNVLVPGEARTEMNQGSTDSPYTVVSMVLTLLSHSSNGPHGKFFHRDGRHLSFTNATTYTTSLHPEI